MNPLSGIAYGSQIAAAAQRHGLDPRLLAAVAAQETGGPGSSSGANVVGDGGHGHGLFQIDDRYHTFASSPQAMDPGQNADYAAGLLSSLLTKYGGNVKEALSAYNAGSPSATGTVTTWGDGSRLGYADSVMRHLAMLGGPSGSLAAENPSNVASVNALSDLYAATPNAGGIASLAADAPSSLAASAPSQSSGLAAAPAAAPQVPVWQPPQWQYHSLQNELQNGGGTVAAKDDTTLGNLVNPMTEDGQSD
jgi:hypothetical protein